MAIRYYTIEGNQLSIGDKAYIIHTDARTQISVPIPFEITVMNIHAFQYYGKYENAVLKCRELNEQSGTADHHSNN